MGNMTALALAEEVGELATLETALAIHLSSNHYPPVHPIFIPTCIEAINYASCEDWDVEIEMPNGVTKTVGQIVEGLHLGAFIPQEY
jgi:hypothetical protein